MRIIAMIPARLGSQRLKQKNLKEIRGAPLIAHAIRKCLTANVFDEIWVNSENAVFGEVAAAEGVQFHQRPEHLGSNTATSEQFVAEFLEKHDCDAVAQVHSIAPLLTAEEVRSFVVHMREGKEDAVMSVIPEHLECMYRSEPVNFTFREKTNSQDLLPVERITWSITGWRRAPYLEAFNAGDCATYAGRIGTWPVGRMAGHVIKTQEDFDIADALWDTVHGTGAAQAA